MKKVFSFFSVLLASTGLTACSQQHNSSDQTIDPLPQEKALEKYENERILSLEKTKEWESIRNIWKEYLELKETEIITSPFIDYEEVEYKKWSNKLYELRQYLSSLEKEYLITSFESGFLYDLLKKSIQEKVPSLKYIDSMSRTIAPARTIDYPSIFYETLDKRIHVMKDLQQKGIITEAEFAQSLENCLIVAKDLLTDFTLENSYPFVFRMNNSIDVSTIIPGEFFSFIQQQYGEIQIEEWIKELENENANLKKEEIIEQYKGYGEQIKQIEINWAETEKLLVSLWK
jgi:hypothetical protein